VRRTARQESVLGAGSSTPALMLYHVMIAFGLLAASALLVIAIEAVSGRPVDMVLPFLLSRPGLSTVAVVAVVALGLDVLMGRAFRSMLLLVPAALVLAFISREKQRYLSDPLYPSDLLFARQINELLPVMVKAHPWEAVATAAAVILGIALIGYLTFIAWGRFPLLSSRARLSRLLVLLPFLLGFTPMMNAREAVWLRDRLGIIPMMWDQKANYQHNGFLLAFALNVPMSKVSAPSGYDAQSIADIPIDPAAFDVARKPAPDVIMIMSESLWDPTKLQDIAFDPDPMPTIRGAQSGQVFSPEFGGMTANVEFEALTGFTNAFLPYGGIPYQQYIRRPLPSLATLFREKGYTSIALHPFEGWFWNRESVYRHLGFDKFLSQEQLPALEKRGMFVSDTALTEQVIQVADAADQPLFLFAVTLQGHGPYEATRYEENRISVGSELDAGAAQQLTTYADGVKEADDSVATLMDWAKRRQRETIIVLFGDHLPPLGRVFTESGYMADAVATRRASLDVMKREHETPLVVWSSKTGPVTDLETISPSLLPYHIVRSAGFSDPFYTGFLGEVASKYSVIDRYMLVDKNGYPHPGWSERNSEIDPSLQNYRLLQYDMMFGRRHARGSFFPPAETLPAEDDDRLVELSQAGRSPG
jgi:phosphoglycerol transferase MdoB-like AlkP superfamily enzyme